MAIHLGRNTKKQLKRTEKARRERLRYDARRKGQELEAFLDVASPPEYKPLEVAENFRQAINAKYGFETFLSYATENDPGYAQTTRAQRDYLRMVATSHGLLSVGSNRTDLPR